MMTFADKLLLKKCISCTYIHRDTHIYGYKIDYARGNKRFLCVKYEDIDPF